MNIAECISKYADSYPEEESKLISIMGRYIASEWGYEYPEGVKRLSPQLKLQLINFLEGIEVKKLKNIKDIFTKNTEGIKQGIPPKKYTIKKFYEWCVEGQLFLPKTNQIKLVIQKKYSLEDRKRIRKNKANKPYRLMGRNNITKKLIHPGDYINENLEKDIEYYKESRKISDGSLRKEISMIYRYLGWLHRYENIPLSELRLDSIIQYTDVVIFDINSLFLVEEENIKNFVRKYKEQYKNSESIADENIAQIRRHVDFVKQSNVTKNTLLIFLDCVLEVIKFIYKDTLKADISIKEIPIVKRLNRLNKEIQNDDYKNKGIDYCHKMPTFEEIEKVLEILLNNANATHQILRKTINPVKDVSKSKHLQKFLAVALCTVMPTDRARTYYELELGRTLVLGSYDYRFKKFTPKAEMSNPEDAIWYIHLMPEDYKTGHIYGEIWDDIPNHKFSDGSLLYNYIDLWINKYRETKGKCNHNYFFRGDIDYKPCNSYDWGNYIVTIFIHHLNIPCRPNTLRHAYVTHLRNTGASEEVKKAAAVRMKHSIKMANEIYNEQTREDMTRPWQEWNQQQRQGK